MEIVKGFLNILFGVQFAVHLHPDHSIARHTVTRSGHDGPKKRNKHVLDAYSGGA
jgi:hypothetical protein